MKIFLSFLLAICFSMHTLYSQTSSKYLNNPLPESWVSEDSLVRDDLYNPSSVISTAWWSEFNDPLLDQSIEATLKSNFSLLAAYNRVIQAKAMMKSAASQFYPSLKLSDGWTNQRSSGNVTALPAANERFFYSSLQSTWEIDIFGSIRNRYKAQRKEYQVSVEEYNGVILSLISEVGVAYFNLRATQQELKVLNENAASQKSVLDITLARYNAGLSSKLDVAQAQSVYSSTKASIPSLETAVESYIGALAVLMGVYPNDIRDKMMVAAPLPEKIIPVEIGLPMALIQRRPDIRQAEKQVEAQAALLGASRSDWFPQFFLNTSIGFQSNKLNQLYKKNSLTYQIAPVMTWTIFAGTQRIQATRQAKAALQESVDNFNQLVISAIQETDQYLVAYSNSIKQLVALKEVVYRGQEVLSLSVELYKDGLAPFQNVLDAQRSLLTYQSQYVQAQNSSIQQLINLYKALGGGWESTLNNNR